MQPSTITHPPQWIVICDRRETPLSVPTRTTTKPITRKNARRLLARLIFGARQRRLHVVAEGEDITFAESHTNQATVTAFIAPAVCH